MPNLANTAYANNGCASMQIRCTVGSSVSGTKYTVQSNGDMYPQYRLDLGSSGTRYFATFIGDDVLGLNTSTTSNPFYPNQIPSSATSNGTATVYKIASFSDLSFSKWSFNGTEMTPPSKIIVEGWGEAGNSTASTKLRLTYSSSTTSNHTYSVSYVSGATLYLKSNSNAYFYLAIKDMYVEEM